MTMNKSKMEEEILEVIKEKIEKSSQKELEEAEEIIKEHLTHKEEELELNKETTKLLKGRLKDVAKGRVISTKELIGRLKKKIGDEKMNKPRFYIMDLNNYTSEFLQEIILWQDQRIKELENDKKD